MRYLLIILLFVNANLFAQTADNFFNKAANEYLYQDQKLALQTIDEGLLKYPQDEELTRLRDKINKEQEDQENQEQEQEQEQNQEENEQEQEQEQQQEQQSEEESEQSEEEQESEEQKQEEQEGEPEEQEQTEEEEQEQQQMQEDQIREKLEEMNMTEEKAMMILEALKNNEIQYIQQNKRKASKPADRSKPDW